MGKREICMTMVEEFLHEVFEAVRVCRVLELGGSHSGHV